MFLCRLSSPPNNTPIKDEGVSITIEIGGVYTTIQAMVMVMKQQEEEIQTWVPSGI